MTAHSHFPRGSHVYVILRDGTRFDARFLKNDDNTVYFKDHEPLRIRKVRSMGYYRNPTYVSAEHTK